MKKKLVSIIIPVFKNIHFLKRSLHSSVHQTYKNTEIIIIDDGNTKNEKKEIKEVRQKFKKKEITIIYLKKNKGVSNALNVGIKKSRGEYISWLSHDDYFDLNKTQMQIKHLNKTNAKICSCDFIEINKIKNFRLNRSLDKNYFDDQVLSIILNDSLHGCSLLIKKECFEEFNFNKKYKHIQDYDLWTKMSEKYLIVHLKKRLLYTFKHVSQTSYLKKDESVTEKLYFYKDLVNKKLVFYNYSQFIYVIKFIYRSIFMYKSLSLGFLVFQKFLFNKYYNYLRLYLKKN